MNFTGFPRARGIANPPCFLRARQPRGQKTRSSEGSNGRLTGNQGVCRFSGSVAKNAGCLPNRGRGHQSPQRDGRKRVAIVDLEGVLQTCSPREAISREQFGFRGAGLPNGPSFCQTARLFAKRPGAFANRAAFLPIEPRFCQSSRENWQKRVAADECRDVFARKASRLSVGRRRRQKRWAIRKCDVGDS